MAITRLVDPWPEDDFRRYLRAERRVYAWCLVRLAGITESEAGRRALECYPNPNSDELPPGMLLGVRFNMGAWRIASREVFPEFPGHRSPDEFGLRGELEAEIEGQFRGEPWKEPLADY